MFDLVNAFRFVKSPLDTIELLEDLLSGKEIKNLSKRLRIAKLLLSDHTYQEIVFQLHCSFATVAKVNAWLLQGGKGFRNVIKQLPKCYKFPKKLPPIPIEFQLPQVLSSLYQYTRAHSQNNQLEQFFKGVANKEENDRQLREQFSDNFRLKGKRKK